MMNADELRIAADLCDDNHFPEAARVLREKVAEIEAEEKRMLELFRNRHYWDYPLPITKFIFKTGSA